MLHCYLRRLEMMMIAMIMTILLSVHVSVLVTTNAAFLHDRQMQASHDLDYDRQHVLSPGVSRKLMLSKKVEGYEEQDLVFYNDQKEPLLGESWKSEEEVMVLGSQEPDLTRLTTMDYSHVRRRRPIHNNYSPKTNISP